MRTLLARALLLAVAASAVGHAAQPPRPPQVFDGAPAAPWVSAPGAGNEYGVFNGFCGAESGYVPVSTVAPAALITELELQRTVKANERSPVLPGPWAKSKKP